MIYFGKLLKTVILCFVFTKETRWISILSWFWRIFRNAARNSNWFFLIRSDLLENPFSDYIDIHWFSNILFHYFSITFFILFYLNILSLCFNFHNFREIKKTTKPKVNFWKRKKNVNSIDSKYIGCCIDNNQTVIEVCRFYTIHMGSNDYKVKLV